MYQFAEGHIFFQRAGLLLLMVQLALFSFGLPPFHVGIWLQTEPDMLALYTLCMGNAMWLLYGVLSKALAPQRGTPLFYCLLAWVAWQVVPTFFALSPWRSWFGPVEMGEGGAWQLCLLLIMMQAYPLWQVRNYRNILLIWAALVISTESLLHVLFSTRTNKYTPGVWIPAQWGAYLAYMVGYFWVMMMSAGYVRSLGLYMAMIAFAADVVIISYNKTAIGLLPFAIAVSFGIFLWQRKKQVELLPGKRMRLAGVALVLAPTAWILFAAAYVPPPGNVEHYGIFNLSHKDSPLGSRIGLMQIGIEALEHEPRRWLVGAGWGEYTDSIFRYALLPGVHMFKNGERSTNWSFVDGNAYHSHSQPLEALLALGLPGMLLWFAIPVAVMLTIPARLFWQVAPMLLMMNTVSYMWFQLPQCVPMQGMMLAALCAACATGREGQQAARRSWRPVAAPLLVVATIAMALTAMQHNVAMYYGERLYKGTRYLPVKQYPLERLRTDFFRGADRLRTATMGFALSLDKERGDIDQRQHDWYAQFMALGHEMMVSPMLGPRANYMALWLQYKLLLNLGYPIFADLGHEAAQGLRETVVTMAKKAPLRDDIASFYFLNFNEVTHNDKALQEEILNEILAAAPNHRSAKWMLGQLLLDTPDRKEEGERLIREAVAARVQDVYAVTDEELQPWLAAAE